MSSSDLSPTLMPATSAKKPRDTTNRLEVRMHRSTTFLAFAYKGTLWEFFPRGSFLSVNATGCPAGITSVPWTENKGITPALFGLLAYRKTPYRFSKGEQGTPT